MAIIEYNINEERSPFPLVRCRNVYVLPGIPALLQRKWTAVKDMLLSHGDQSFSLFHTIMLRLKLYDETRIAAALSEVAKMYAEVAVGSYPVSNQVDGCGVVMCLESKKQDELEKAKEKLIALLPEDIIIASEHKDEDTALNSPAESGLAPADS